MQLHQSFILQDRILNRRKKKAPPNSLPPVSNNNENKSNSEEPPNTLPLNQSMSGAQTNKPTNDGKTPQETPRRISISDRPFMGVGQTLPKLKTDAATSNGTTSVIAQGLPMVSRTKEPEIECKIKTQDDLR